jgi:dolichyl-phosphate-mannose-protein mannosyltransferase
VFGPSGEDRPDVLTDAETVVLPIWLHRRASSTDGKTGASAASFLKTITVPAQEDIPAQEDAATRGAGTESVSNDRDVGAEAGDPEPADPARAEQGEAEAGDAEPGDTEPGDAEPGDAEPGDAEPGEAEPGEAGLEDASPDAAAEAKAAEADGATATATGTQAGGDAGTVAGAGAALAPAQSSEAESAEGKPTTAEPPAAESPGAGVTGARIAGSNAPTAPRGTRPDAEVTTTLSRAELKTAMVQARTLEAIEAIEAIDALESSTLGGLEARTARALDTVEAISALEAKTAQAIKTIEAMTADAFQAIDATVAEMMPEVTSTLVPPDQVAQADEAGTGVTRTRVIRIDEPPASVTVSTSSTETTIAVPQPRAESLVAVAPAPAVDRSVTLTPVPQRDRSEEPAALPPAGPHSEPSAEPGRPATQRRTRVNRGLLLCILALQAILSLRLHNTAFEDEALYIYSGHMELQHLLHGAALQGSYASYFSGSPLLYPVAAGFLNGLGGLTAARMLSLVEMLSITALLYSMSRRLFNERIALCAALLFSVCESAIFLGNFATYDATCLFLLSLAAWIMVRTAGFRWPVFLLAAPVAALAVGVKYAGLLFVPTIAVLPAVAGWPLRGRRVLLYPPVFIAAVGGLLYGGLRLGGTAYMTAISSTTTQRAQGVTPVTTLLKESAEWGGVIFVLAVIGTVAYVRRIRTEPEELIAPAGGRFWRLCLGLLLTGTALLAPAYQAHLHTDVSFQKHIGFGLFFAAPMAGLGLARLLGDHFRRPHIAVGVWSLALVLGLVQSTHLYQVWPNSSQFVRTFSAYLKPHARYLVEVPEVPIYYLLGHQDAQPSQFTSTFYINYRNSKGVLLTGTVGFTAAVDAGYFHVVAYNNEITGAADAVLAQALSASKDYYLAAEIHITDVFGPGDYFIWVKGQPPNSAHAFAQASSTTNPRLGGKLQQLGP